MKLVKLTSDNRMRK